MHELQQRVGNSAIGHLLGARSGARPSLVVARAPIMGGLAVTATTAAIEGLVEQVAGQRDDGEAHGISTGTVASVVEQGVEPDEELLTNVVFWALHPEARYRVPGSDEADLQAHRDLLRRDVVRPALPITAERLGRFRGDDPTAFRREVFRRQREQKLEEGKPFLWGVDRTDLAPTIVGGKLLHVDVVGDFNDMWRQARADLKDARARGVGQAKKTKSIGVGSAYRAAADDFDNWITAFDNNYQDTAKERKELRGGPHGEKAIRKMVRRMNAKKAVPGYSNHTHGRAVDVVTRFGEPAYEVDGEKRGGIYDFGASGAQSAGWPNTWLHQWLTANAGSFNFEPYSAEEWHWNHVTAREAG